MEAIGADAVESGGIGAGEAIGGAAGGVSAACAKAFGAADASMAATALARARRCKVVRVDISEKAPFY